MNLFTREMRMSQLLPLWISVAALMGVALVVSQLAEIPHRSALRGYDNTFNYLWLRSAVVDRDWDFANDLAACNTLTPEYREAALSLPRTKRGLVPNKYGLGWAVLTSPAYAVAELIVQIGRRTGLWTFEADGFNPVYQVCIQLGHVALAVAGLWLAVRAVTAWVGDRRAAMTGVAWVWATSPQLYYQTADVGMSHSAAFFGGALLAFALIRAQEAPQRTFVWIVTGAAWGLLVITRFQLGILLVPVVGVLFLSGDATGLLPRARWYGKRAVLILGGATPFLLLQAIAWKSVYGDWLVFSYGAEGEGFHWARPALWRSLFSSWHGLFSWHPFLLLATIGAIGWSLQNKRVGGPWLVVVFVTIYVNAAWWCWWFASAFGSRAFDAALLPLMAGAAWLATRPDPRIRGFCWAAATAAAAWNGYAVLLYRTGAISRSAPVSWLEMLQATNRLPDAIRF